MTAPLSLYLLSPLYHIFSAPSTMLLSYGLLIWETSSYNRHLTFNTKLILNTLHG